MKKVAIYIRVSTLEQAEHGYSVSEQTDRLTKFCEVKDWMVYNTYVDSGHSAATLERPALQRMIKDIEHYDSVLVYKLDRLSRSQKDTLYLIEDVFNKKEIDFVSLNENLDTSTPFGKAMIGILSVFSQLEREQIAERMAMGRRGRARSGKATSWTEQTRPYGYEVVDDVYRIVPHEAKIIVDIFNRILDGASTNSIVSEFRLNNVGNKPWHHVSITRMLSNPIYYGGMPYKEEVFKGLHEPLITKEEFDLVQKELEKRKIKSDKMFDGRRPFQSIHPLSGALVCGICGAPMTVTYSTAVEGKKPNIRYKCKTRVKSYRLSRGIDNKCSNITYANEDLEKVLYSELNKVKSKVTLSAEQSFYQPDTESYTQEIDSLDRQKERLIDLYVENLIDKGSYEERKEAIESQQQYLYNEINELKSESELIQEQNELIEKIQSLPDDIYTLPKEERKEIADRLVDEMVVSPAGTKVYWSFDKPQI